jgi:hypothetical protein
MKQIRAAVSDLPEQPRIGDGCVVLYSPEHSGFGRSHERLTRVEIAKKIAKLKRLEFAGDYKPSTRHSAQFYFIPSDTLVGVEAARELGICTEHDLFGGVVPWPFVTTKVITHPLVHGDAYAPHGWSHEFGRLVRDAVPLGFSVFTPEDVRRAGIRLLENGPVRIKPVRATGGGGQLVAFHTAEIEDLAGALEPDELSTYGLVLEENLTEVTTYSIGQVRVADLLASYCGTQHTTSDNSGAAVYGGSELLVARGDFDTLLRIDLPDQVRLALAQARAYETAAMECFPGLFASRRNYDVIQGLNAKQGRRSGVLEQSWRIGGASTAEISALETFRGQPDLTAVCAASVEVYGESGQVPPDATIFFRGIDEQVGAITKYTLVKTYDAKH